MHHVHHVLMLYASCDVSAKPALLTDLLLRQCLPSGALVWPKPSRLSPCKANCLNLTTDPVHRRLDQALGSAHDA